MIKLFLYLERREFVRPRATATMKYRLKFFKKGGHVWKIMLLSANEPTITRAVEADIKRMLVKDPQHLLRLSSYSLP